jgi:NAD(P)-dependent dehydrogenase (short-subunit alcohol dehydrogenase family)
MNDALQLHPGPAKPAAQTGSGAYPPLRSWHGRRAWIVGASSGIGLALAEKLHAAGAQVVVSARNAQALQALVARLPGAVALPLDVQDRAALRDAAARVDALGGIDCVVYCAGHYKPQRATAFDLSEMLLHQQVNYVGALYLLDAVLPSMLARRSGHISLVSSVAGYRGLPQGLAYGPTKAALINLAETLYMDLSDQGIGVSVINPGFVETPLTAQNQFAMPALISPAQAADAILKDWARGRFEIHFPKRFTLWLKAARLMPFGLYQRMVRRLTGL